jgi:hypothetical protein
MAWRLQNDADSLWQQGSEERFAGAGAGERGGGSIQIRIKQICGSVNFPFRCRSGRPTTCHGAHHIIFGLSTFLFGTVAGQDLLQLCPSEAAAILFGDSVR